MCSPAYFLPFYKRKADSHNTSRALLRIKNKKIGTFASLEVLDQRDIVHIPD
jgi:hypothetical protein